MHGIDEYDSQARWYYPAIMRTTTMDPLCEKYYSTSPYAWCNNNPVNYVDPDGRATFWADGEEIGNDGVDDGRILWLKTTQKYFGSEEIVRGAGVKRQTYKETIDFIKANSGNAEAFTNNSLAYDNSIEMPVTFSELRQIMIDCIKDNGLGGIADANNREYGGCVSNYARKVHEASPSAVGDNGIEIDFPAPAYIPFHSHWSGNKSIRLDSNPSPGDINAIAGKVGFVFGMRDGIVYLFNSSGVQATCPMKYFVNPKR